MAFSPGFLEGVKDAAEINSLEYETDEEHRRCFVYVDGYNPIVFNDMVPNVASAQIVLEDLTDIEGYTEEKAFDMYMEAADGLGAFSVGLVDDRYLCYSIPVHDYGRFVDAIMECCLVDDKYDIFLGKEVPESRLV